MIDRLGFGCVALTSFATPGEAVRLLETAFDLGVRHFDTAPVYGQGYSERLLGKFLRGRRDQVSVATKFGMTPSRPPNLPLSLALAMNAARRRLARPRPSAPVSGPPEEAGDAAPVRRIGREEVQRAFDASRRSLNTDHIDLYLLHENVPAALSPDAVELLHGLRATGQVRQIGLAAGAARYKALAPADIQGWDVLQYEAGPAWPESRGLLRQFPEQRHVFHSCLRGIPRHGDPEAAGRVLAEMLALDPHARVLFSSTRAEHIRANLKVLAA